MKIRRHDIVRALCRMSQITRHLVSPRQPGIEPFRKLSITERPIESQMFHVEHCHRSPQIFPRSIGMCHVEQFKTALRIPRGLYFEGPAVPGESISSVGMTSFLAGRADVSSKLVTTTLDALYSNDLRSEIPNLLPRATAASWSELPTHPATRSYLQPYSGLGLLASADVTSRARTLLC